LTTQEGYLHAGSLEGQLGLARHRREQLPARPTAQAARLSATTSRRMRTRKADTHVDPPAADKYSTQVQTSTARRGGKYRSLASCWMASYMLKNLWHVALSLTLCRCTTCRNVPRPIHRAASHSPSYQTHGRVRRAVRYSRGGPRNPKTRRGRGFSSRRIKPGPGTTRVCKARPRAQKRATNTSRLLPH